VAAAATDMQEARSGAACASWFWCQYSQLHSRFMRLRLLAVRTVCSGVR
jgi:hypothetical protein